MAQKTVFIYHTVPKNPERVFPKLENSFFSALETSEKCNLLFRKIFQVFGKKNA